MKILERLTVQYARRCHYRLFLVAPVLRTNSIRTRMQTSNRLLFEPSLFALGDSEQSVNNFFPNTREYRPRSLR